MACGAAISVAAAGPAQAATDAQAAPGPAPTWTLALFTMTPPAQHGQISVLQHASLMLEQTSTGPARVRFDWFRSSCTDDGVKTTCDLESRTFDGQSPVRADFSPNQHKATFAVPVDYADLTWTHTSWDEGSQPSLDSDQVA
jgi:hypothetical protein